MLRLAFVVTGGFVGLLAAFVFDLGARPCRDVFVEEAAACALPQPSAWGIALSVVVGVAIPLAALRFDEWRSRR